MVGGIVWMWQSKFSHIFCSNLLSRTEILKHTTISRCNNVPRCHNLNLEFIPFAKFPLSRVKVKTMSNMTITIELSFNTSIPISKMTFSQKLIIGIKCHFWRNNLFRAYCVFIKINQWFFTCVPVNFECRNIIYSKWTSQGKTVLGFNCIVTINQQRSP